MLPSTASAPAHRPGGQLGTPPGATPAAAENDAARCWARIVAAELVDALLRDCETSKEVWRAGMNVLSALGSSHGGGDDRSDRADAPEDAELLRVAALDAAAGARGARVSRTDIVEGCVWFTVRTVRETGS